jgi:hypothetical protein
MDAASLRNLETLTDTGSRGAAEMRSALLRILTDLYVQKLTHTSDEERHYTELALRLIESVNAPTRAAVAAQLSKHISPPNQVVKRLAGDPPQAAGALPPPHPAACGTTVPMAEPLPHRTNESRGREVRAAIVTSTETAPAAMSDATGRNVASELNEIFFAASALERRLILLNLDVVAPVAAERPRISPDESVAKRLEAGALARKRGDFVQELAQSLQISREQARRIVEDELGEPIVIAAKALSVPRELLYRILLFVNTSVGHSVERVYTLAQLYDEITSHVAQDMVAIWQALGNGRSNAVTHEPLLAHDKPGVQSTPATQRTLLPRRNERREAS